MFVKASMFSQGVTPTGMLVLLGLNSKPQYGPEIRRAIERNSKGLISIPLGTLYPLLYSLEESGMIQVAEGLNSARHRYYQITDRGRSAIKEMLDLQSALLNVKED